MFIIRSIVKVTTTALLNKLTMNAVLLIKDGDMM